MVNEPSIQVTVVYSPGPREVHEVTLQTMPSSTVEQALQASGFLQRFPELAAPSIALGVWGRKARMGQRLRDRDRVEIYRPLTVDPKVARRERFARQGARAAGLFVKKRAGAKAGY